MQWITFAPNGAVLWGVAGGSQPAIAWSDLATNGVLRLQRIGDLGERLPIEHELPTIGHWDTLTITLELPRPAILACTAGSCELDTLSPDLARIDGQLARFPAPGAFDLRQDADGYTFLEWGPLARGASFGRVGLDGRFADSNVLPNVGAFIRIDNGDGTQIAAWDDGSPPAGTASAALFSRDGLWLTYTRRIPIGPLPYCQWCTWYPVATSTPVGAMLLWTAARPGPSLPTIATLALTRDGHALQPPVDLGLLGFRIHGIVYAEGDVLAAAGGGLGNDGLDLFVLDPLSGRARGDAQHVAIDGQIVSVKIVATDAGAVVVFGVLTPTSRDLYSVGVQCRRS